MTYSAIVPPPLQQANALAAEEQKTGVTGEYISASPSRRGSKAGGRFQRRLEEASAEVVAESAAAPQIAAAAEGEAVTGGACLSSSRAAAELCQGESTKTAKIWSDDQLKSAAASSRSAGDGGTRQRWTPAEDRRLECLVRECVFDFDLVAARFSSAGDVGCGDGGKSHDVYIFSLMMMLLSVHDCLNDFLSSVQDL